MSARRTILLSAYACEPGKGSEPGVGWRWACGLAGRVNLHVLTRAANRDAIENALASGSVMPRDATVIFHYHDLSVPFLWAKRVRLLPTSLYYVLWQWTAARRFASLADQMDVVHHLTFCTLLCPGFWRLRKARFVVGPVGAPMVNPHYLPLFGKTAVLQRMRGGLMRGFLKLPWLRRLLRSAAAVVPANSETRALLLSRGIAAREVMLDTGPPEDVSGRPRSTFAGPPFRLVYAGRLERRKGLELAFKALAQTARGSSMDWTFDIFGDGPDKGRLERLSGELGLKSRIRFHGTLPRAELLGRFHEADAFLFTSIRDTSGGVNLEAMACGLPVICIAHQGVGDITDDSCAERVQPGPVADTISRLAEAIERLGTDPRRCAAMSEAAIRRASKDFNWEGKFERMCAYYEDALGKQ